MAKIGWFDFHRAEEAIAHGRRAAERTIESIEEAIAILAPGYVALPSASPAKGDEKPTDEAEKAAG